MLMEFNQNNVNKNGGAFIKPFNLDTDDLDCIVRLDDDLGEEMLEDDDDDNESSSSSIDGPMRESNSYMSQS